MPRFADLTVSSFLDALASPEPTPGGGTAAAIAAAIGTSLMMMVAGLTHTRHRTEAEKTALGGARQSLATLREDLIRQADADTVAFNQVMSAYRLPKATDAEKAARKPAVQQALRVATDVPLDTLKTAVLALERSRVVAEYGNPSAASDVRVALELLEAAAAGAAANVEINIISLEDEAYKTRTAASVVELTNQLTEHAAAARAALAAGT
jgi:formiminotetrahydrofolate cyclodeaminase